MRLNKRLGQHFLSDYSILKRESNLFKCDNKIVLEIGGGDGRLSKHLYYKCKKLYIVEKDERFINHLNSLFVAQPTVEVLGVDFLKLKPFNVDLIVGNVPYYISSPIVFKLLDWDFESAFLMFQKEFGLKLLEKGKNKSRLSFFTQYYFTLNKHFIIPKKAFTPPPKVDSILIEFKRKKVKRLDDDVHKLISFLYQHKPKKIKSTLKIYSKINKVELNLDSELLDKRIYELTTRETINLANEILNKK